MDGILFVLRIHVEYCDLRPRQILGETWLIDKMSFDWEPGAEFNSLNCRADEPVLNWSDTGRQIAFTSCWWCPGKPAKNWENKISQQTDSWQYLGLNAAPPDWHTRPNLQSRTKRRNVRIFFFWQLNTGWRQFGNDRIKNVYPATRVTANAFASPPPKLNGLVIFFSETWGNDLSWPSHTVCVRHRR